MVMEIFADPENEVELKIMRACILGDSLRGIMRKTGIPESTLKTHLQELVKTRMLALNRVSRYYFVTAKGERLLSASESLG